MALKTVPSYEQRESKIFVDCCIKNVFSFSSLSAPLICILNDDSINTHTQNLFHILPKEHFYIVHYAVL